MADYPVPKPGLVIRYSYLWKREAEAGRVEGLKDRPCVVVLAVTREGAQVKVTVAPITHKRPPDMNLAVQLTTPTIRRLGLEGASWVMASEVNIFSWPGPDLRPTPTGRYEYGELPEVVFEALKAKILGNKPAGEVSRTE